MEPDGWPISTTLTSPTCRCTAIRDINDEIRIHDAYNNNTCVSIVIIGGNSGPLDLVNNTIFKASMQYFPLGMGPYRIDLNDKCYLYVTDGKGVVVWESMFNRMKQRVIWYLRVSWWAAL